jgi:hypothetical protein
MPAMRYSFVVDFDCDQTVMAYAVALAHALTRAREDAGKTGTKTGDKKTGDRPRFYQAKTVVCPRFSVPGFPGFPGFPRADRRSVDVEWVDDA